MAQFNLHFYFVNFRTYEKSVKSVQGNQIVKAKNGELGYMLTLGQYNDQNGDFEVKTVFPEFGKFDYPEGLELTFMDEIICRCSIETANAGVRVEGIESKASESPYLDKIRVNFRLFENAAEAREAGYIK